LPPPLLGFQRRQQGRAGDNTVFKDAATPKALLPPEDPWLFSSPAAPSAGE